MLGRPLHLVPLAVVAGGLLGAGCGTTTIDQGKAESLVHQAVAAAPGAQQPTSVHCPSGVTAKAGTTFNCDIAYADGTKGTVTEHINDSSGHTTIGPDDLHLQTAAGAAGKAGTK